jgi:hypothetical protein
MPLWGPLSGHCGVRYAGEIANTRITEAGADRAGSIDDQSRIQKEKSLSGEL